MSETTKTEDPEDTEEYMNFLRNELPKLVEKEVRRKAIEEGDGKITYLDKDGWIVRENLITGEKEKLSFHGIHNIKVEKRNFTI